MQRPVSQIFQPAKLHTVTQITLYVLTFQRPHYHPTVVSPTQTAITLLALLEVVILPPINVFTQMYAVDQILLIPLELADEIEIVIMLMCVLQKNVLMAFVLLLQTQTPTIQTAVKYLLTALAMLVKQVIAQ